MIGTNEVDACAARSRTGRRHLGGRRAARLGDGQNDVGAAVFCSVLAV
jgi:hypothetical protein